MRRPVDRGHTIEWEPTDSLQIRDVERKVLLGWLVLCDAVVDCQGGGTRRHAKMGGEHLFAAQEDFNCFGRTSAVAVTEHEAAVESFGKVVELDATTVERDGLFQITGLLPVGGHHGDYPLQPAS